MIKFISFRQKKQYYSDAAGLRGWMEMLVFYNRYSQINLRVQPDWIKTTAKPDGTYYYMDFFGSQINSADDLLKKVNEVIAESENPPCIYEINHKNNPAGCSHKDGGQEMSDREFCKECKDYKAIK